MTPGSRPSCAAMMMLANTERGSHLPSSGFFLNSVRAMRAMRSGLRCFGRARAICCLYSSSISGKVNDWVLDASSDVPVAFFNSATDIVSSVYLCGAEHAELDRLYRVSLPLL